MTAGPLFSPLRFVTLRVLIMLLSLLFALSSTGYCADQEEEKSPDSGTEIELDGLVVHQAKSRLGNDFFQYFASYWYPPQGIKGYNIFIRDEVHPRFGTWVFISVNDVVVQRLRLESRLWEIKDAAKQSITRVSRYVTVNFGGQRLSMPDEDLAGNGL